MLSVILKWLTDLAFQLAKRVAEEFSQPLAALRNESPHKRTATDDARLQLEEWTQKRPVPFALAGSIAAGAMAGVVPSELDWWLRVLLGAAGAGLALFLVIAGAFFYYLLGAPRRQRDAARAALLATEQGQPAAEPASGAQSTGDRAAADLSFGRAQIPKEAQRFSHLLEDRAGRVIQVPVSNARGATLAKAVHAVLTFMPDDSQGSFSPQHPIQAEWLNDDGSLTTSVDLPGNGQARYFHAALVTNSGYPFIFAWSHGSREARLAGFEVWSGRAEIDVEVMGSGEVPVLKNTLIIEGTNGTIRADWVDKSGDESTNWISKQGRGWHWS